MYIVINIQNTYKMYGNFTAFWSYVYGLREIVGMMEEIDF
jgi:hypothetical protein